MLITLAFIPVGLSGGARRLLPLPHLRRDQAVSGAPARDAPRRLRRHGRRCDGGDLRQPVAAAADGGLSPMGGMTSGMSSEAPICRRPRSLPSGASCSARRALDTNSLYLAERLVVARHRAAVKTVVGDSRREVAEHLRRALDRVRPGHLDRRPGPDRRRPDARRGGRRAGPAPHRARRHRRAPQRAVRAARASRCRTSTGARRTSSAGGVILDNPNGTAPGLLVERRPSSS